MKTLYTPVLALALLGWFAPSAMAQERIPVTVVSVKDGDTLKVRELAQDIRIASIDAPETGHGRQKQGQPFGQAARTALVAMMGPAGKASVQAACYERDRYERHICDIFVDGQSAGRTLVAMGLAWANTSNSGRYLRDRELLKIQDQSKAVGKGLWAARNPVEPWQWRKACWVDLDCPQ